MGLAGETPLGELTTVPHTL